MIGAAIVLFFVVIAVFAPLIAPFDPNASDWMVIRQPSSAAHWFGTDDLGRDVLSRIIFGARASLAAGVVSVAVAVLVGVPFGLVAGFFGRFADMAISRVADALLACPFLVLAIAFAAFLGPSLQNAMIAIGISAMPIFVRVARAQTLVVCTEDYIAAARSQGIGDFGDPHRSRSAERARAHCRAGDADHGDRGAGRSEPGVPRARTVAPVAFLGQHA